jgi:Cys-tRNA(Pro)/Cys-tRNA(Cys) deacylase
MAQAKTNAQRMLEKEKIPYLAHTYETEDGHIDGVSVAHKMGIDPAVVFKTLVTRGASRGIYIFVVPVALELNLKAAARAVGEKSVEMIAVKEITPLTGYIRGGCSPIGMKKHYPTVVDESARLLERMIVSAGRIGDQIELAPGDLQKATGCSFAAVAE